MEKELKQLIESNVYVRDAIRYRALLLRVRNILHAVLSEDGHRLTDREHSMHCALEFGADADSANLSQFRELWDELVPTAPDPASDVHGAVDRRGPVNCETPCVECDSCGGHHWVDEGWDLSDPDGDEACSMPVLAGLPVWFGCKHCDAWCEIVKDDAEDNERERWR
jgi:hypothetical protein